MQISGISQSSYASNLYTMQQQLLGTSTGSTSSKSSSKASSGYVTTSDLTSLAQYSMSAMDAMGIGANGRVTFGQISSYRSEQEKKFSEQLQSDLEALGVDKNIKFQLSMDDDGKIVVNTDHEDKAKVEKYFEDNPEMVSKYKEIQALNNLESARKSLQISPTELKKRIQIQSMASWWANSDNQTSSIADYYAGSMSMYSGINTTV